MADLGVDDIGHARLAGVQHDVSLARGDGDGAGDVAVVGEAAVADLHGRLTGIAVFQQNAFGDVHFDVAALDTVGVVVAMTDLRGVQPHLHGGAGVRSALDEEAPAFHEHGNVP